MDKSAVITRYKELLEELGEPADSVVLSAGAALVILGINKDVNSLDVDVPKNIFNWLGNKYEIISEEGTVPRIKFSQNVTIRILEDTIGVINNDGIWTYSISELITQKRYLSTMTTRPESKKLNDQVDLLLLQTFKTAKMLTATFLDRN